MLQTIRDRTQGWIAGIIISILIFSFALWGIHSYLIGAGSTNVVAKVDGIEITKSQLANAYERLRRQLQMQYSTSTLPNQVESGLKDRALQTLVNIEVLRQASFSQKYRISHGQVNSFLENVPEFQVNGHFSASRFQQVLSTTLFTTKDFLDLIQTSLLIDQPRLGLIFSSFALPDEISSTMALIGQERNIQYAVLPYQQFAKQAAAISADKIQAYYNDHPDEFQTPEQVTIEYIQLSTKDLTSSLNPNDQTLKTFYTDNINMFTQPAQWTLESLIVPVSDNNDENTVKKAEEQANQLAQKAKTEKNFMSLAKTYSATKANDSLQGQVTLDKFPAEFQRVLSALTQPGQVSTPIRTQDGFVVIKVDSYKNADIKTFDSIKDKVKDAWLQQQAVEKFGSLRDKLSQITYEHPDSLQAASKELNLPIQTTASFTRDKGNKDIADNPKVREAAFSNDVLNAQNNSDVIPVGSDSVIVLRVKAHVPASLLPLTTVSSQISDKLKQVETESLTAKAAQEINQKLQSGATLDAITKQYALTWNNTGFIGRHSNKVDSAVLEIAFSMPQPKASKPTFSTTQTKDGYAIVELTDVRSNPPANIKEQYSVFGEQIQNANGLLEYELYKQSLIQDAKVTIVN